MLDDWLHRWEQSVRRYGQQIALTAPQGVLSFQKLDERAQAWKRTYQQQPGWRTGCCEAWPWHSSWNDLPRLLGLWLAGGVWIAHPDEDSYRALAIQISQDIQGPDRGEGCWQSILFSSGSTGQPKPLVRGWRQALIEADANAAHMDLTAGSQVAMLIQPWFGATTKQLLAALFNGWNLAFGHEGLNLLGYQGDLLYATPSQLLALGDGSIHTGNGFAWISLTGESCPANLWPLLQSWARPGAQCLNALGASETGVIATQVLSLDHAWQPFRGKAEPHKRIHIQGESTLGLIDIQGRAFIEGQLVQPKPPEPWHLQPLGRDADGWMTFSSQDLGRWLPSGELELVGRSSHFIKHHGEWLDASPLQKRLEQQPEVRRCQIISQPDGIDAWLALDRPTPQRLESLWQQIALTPLDQRLQPHRLLGIETFPLNLNGKVNLSALMAYGKDPQSRHHAAHNVAIWPVGQPVSAIDLHLDSLDQAQLVSRWNRCNLLWCGPGLAALKASAPSDTSVMSLAFPQLFQGQSNTGSAGMQRMAEQQAEQLIALLPKQPNQRLWLGGFCLPAWWAYAVAVELEKRETAVDAMLLVDPVDPTSPSFRWAWKRNLDHHWRRWKRRLRGHPTSDEADDNKTNRRELLGRWRPTALVNVNRLLVRSRWRKALPTNKLKTTHGTNACLQLPCRRHGQVLDQDEICHAWTTWFWKQVSE